MRFLFASSLAIALSVLICWTALSSADPDLQSLKKGNNDVMENDVLLARTVREAKRNRRKNKKGKQNKARKSKKNRRAKKKRVEKAKKKQRNNSKRKERKIKKKNANKKQGGSKKKFKKQRKNKKAKRKGKTGKSKKMQKKKNKKQKIKRKRMNRRHRQTKALAPCSNGLTQCTSCEKKLHDHQKTYGTQARNWKRQIERAMNNLLNIQKKFASAPDFARHGTHFASVSGNSSCQPPLVKGADTEPQKNSADLANSMNSCNTTIRTVCANPDNLDINSVGNSVLDYRNTGGDLFEKMKACKLALDTYRWYMGAADPNQDPGTSPPGHPGVILSEDDGANGAVAANSDAATFCARANDPAVSSALDDPDTLKAAFVAACTISDVSLAGLGLTADAKPVNLDNALLSYYRTCKTEFGACRKDQRYMCTSSSCNGTSTANPSTTATPCTLEGCYRMVAEDVVCNLSSSSTPLPTTAANATTARIDPSFTASSTPSSSTPAATTTLGATSTPNSGGR